MMKNNVADMMKRLTALLLAVVLTLGGEMITQAQSPDEDGKFPVRVFFEEYGAVVVWYDYDRSIHIRYADDTVIIGNFSIVLFADYNHAYVAGILVELQYGVTIWQDRAFLSHSDLALIEVVLTETILSTFPLREAFSDGWYVEITWCDESRGYQIRIDIGYLLNIFAEAIGEVTHEYSLVITLFADYPHGYINGNFFNLRDGLEIRNGVTYISFDDMYELVMMIYEALFDIMMENISGIQRITIPVQDFYTYYDAVITHNEEASSIHILMSLYDYWEHGSIEWYIVLFTDYPRAYSNGVFVELADGIIVRDGYAYITFADYMLLVDALTEQLYQPGHWTHEFLSDEAQALALYDLDFLERMILENTPWDSVLQRVWQVDLQEEFAFVRREISRSPQILWPAIPGVIPFAEGDCARAQAANLLFDLLFFDLAWQFGGVGHLAPLDLAGYIMLLNANVPTFYLLERPEYALTFQHFLQSMLNPAVVWLYGEHEIDVEAGVVLSEPVPGNIVTESIVYGEIAYMRINSFMSCPEYDDLTIIPFFHSISDYEHLIIDLRGNRGGWGSSFHERIFRRLINEPVELREHQFFARGEYVKAYMEMAVKSALYAENMVFTTEIISAGIMPAYEFIALHQMEYFCPQSLERLGWVFYLTSITAPDDDFSFNGKIWLLVDRNSMSASDDAALLSINTGFATVVGENTGGIMASFVSYVVLPNTGILWIMDLGYFTDADGRSLAVYGVAPDIRNFDGMCALETVLAIIEGDM